MVAKIFCIGKLIYLLFFLLQVQSDNLASVFFSQCALHDLLLCENVLLAYDTS